MDAAARRLIIAAPSRIAPLGIEPAVELDIAQRNAQPPEVVAHAQQRALVSEVVLVMIVILRAAIGPIAEVSQGDVGIVRRTDLPGKIREKATPGLERPVDPRSDHERRHLAESGGDFIGGTYSTGELPAGPERKRRVHVVGGGREDECVGLVIEEDPRAVRTKLGEAEAAKALGLTIAQMVEIPRIR